MTTPTWLERTGLQPDTNGDFSFGDAAAEAAAALHGTVLSPLAQLGLIRATGADAESFLQNQLSNDVRQLGPARAQLSSYNSPKGRVLDLFALRRDGEAILLETRRDTLPASLKRLRMFVLRSKVVLEDASDATVALGLAGADAAALLEQAGLPVPAQDWDHAATGEVTVMRRPGAQPRFSLHGAPASLEALWPQLSAQARPVGSAAWRLLDVLAGLPAIRPETADHFVAQMLNLDQLGAISFTKGCYPGQEIVARMHYLGNLKRRMFLCRGEAAAMPGMEVFAEGSDSPVGEVVDAALHPEGGTALLAVLQLAQTEASLRLGAAGGAALKVIGGPAAA